MKSVIISFCFSLAVVSSVAQTRKTTVSIIDPNKKIEVVETACGECQLGLKGKSCDLAVRIDGKSYFVDGTNINDHGDAHDDDGFCNAVRKAEVQGVLVNNRYKVTYFKLMPAVAKKD
jgi:hypothetical protein